MSQLSSASRITVPKEVRNAVGLRPGDHVSYEVRDGAVILRRVDPFDAAFHTALESTLEEWASPEDDEAFPPIEPWPDLAARADEVLGEQGVDPLPSQQVVADRGER